MLQLQASLKCSLSRQRQVLKGQMPFELYFDCVTDDLKQRDYDNQRFYQNVGENLLLQLEEDVNSAKKCLSRLNLMVAKLD